MRHASRLAAAALLLGLPACGTLVASPEARLPVEERHPVTVDQQTMALRVPLDPEASGLSRAALADIDAFVNAYRTRGHGPITVTAPSGGNDRLGAQTAADVRTALFASGIPYEEMRGATMRGGNGREVVLSFTSYVASGPACGRFGGEVGRRLSNGVSNNFGCAAQSNLAAMIADPRDLQRPAAPDGSGDAGLVSAVADTSED
ncbi:CpaD family pilus assembly lipoprotein [Parvularcula dongshanensis]|uniref:Pilus assembly protein CpaD n=1 Tax=Parvularcula dongshanensis TaxID=1173995 RepID=A0A840HY11_9PROT|nr:pilus assembly protein CpaD [Parvularcula dongshanensis]